MKAKLKLNDFEEYIAAYNKLTQKRDTKIFPAAEFFFSKFRELYIPVQVETKRLPSHEESVHFLQSSQCSGMMKLNVA